MASEANEIEVIVVGAGSIGCAVARELAGRGSRVVVVDPRPPGRQATWAAAGMLSPLGETASSPPLLDLSLESLALFPDLASSLKEDTGIDVRFERGGKLDLALSPGRLEALRGAFEEQSQKHRGLSWLSAAEALEMEPHLSKTVLGGIHYADDAHVDNRRLGQALHRSAELKGATFQIGSRVTSVETSGDRVHAVRLSDGSVLHADRVVIAAGAWSSEIEGVRNGLRPVRGQMLAMVCEPLPIRAMLHTDDVYLIPRHGRVLVGATLEEVGFDANLTDEGQATLLAGAARALPQIADAPVVERWTGLRPGTPDALPVIGRDRAVDGLVYATGHYRNGILLTPVTASIVGDLVEGSSAPGLEERIRAFDPGRLV